MLFLLRSGGRFADQWWPVAGTCESGEDPIDTVIREIREEIGLTPRSVYARGGKMPHPERPGHLELFVAYVAPEAEVVLNYEHSDLKWLTLSETVSAVSAEMEEPIRDVWREFLDSPPPIAKKLWPR